MPGNLSRCVVCRSCQDGAPDPDPVCAGRPAHPEGELGGVAVRCRQLPDRGGCLGIAWAADADLPRPWLAVFSSRVGRIYRADHWWLNRLRAALRRAEECGGTLLTVPGTTAAPWVASVAPFLRVPVCVVFPGAAIRQVVATAVRRECSYEGCHSAAAWCHGWEPTEGYARDLLLWLAADVRLLVHVRRGGNVARLCAEQGGETVPVAEDGRQPGTGHKPTLASGVGNVFPVSELPERGFLFHWTRAQPEGWPDEPKLLRYRRLILGTTHYTAVAALERIARTRCLHAGPSGRRRNLVSLTGVHPRHWPQRRRFRVHRGRWDFEPYGLALSLRFVLARGGCPVVYTVGGAAPAVKHEFVQPDSAGWCWSQEEEWRVPGPLDFADAAPGELFLIAHTRREASQLAQLAGVPCAYYEASG